MKKIILIFTLLFSFCSTYSYAARFGSGKSFGQQRSAPRSHPSSANNQQRSNQQDNRQHTNTPPPPQKSSFASKIFPALAGLTAGALLGSLLAGKGLGGALGAMGSILIGLFVAGIVFFLVKKLFSSRKPSQGFENYQASSTPFSQNRYEEPQNYQNANPYSNWNSLENNMDRNFNRDEFLRNAKTIFIRMQNAYDQKNLTDIRSFTTPEVFAEIQMQIQERGNNTNYTEIVYVDASLQDEHHTESTESVTFSGQIKEQKDAPAIQINETWHFIKDHNNKWIISGIQNL